MVVCFKVDVTVDRRRYITVWLYTEVSSLVIELGISVMLDTNLLETNISHVRAASGRAAFLSAKLVRT